MLAISASIADARSTAPFAPTRFTLERRDVARFDRHAPPASSTPAGQLVQLNWADQFSPAWDSAIQK